MVDIRAYEQTDVFACCEIITSCLPAMPGLNSAAHDYCVAETTPQSLHAELSSALTLVATEPPLIALASLRENEIVRLYVKPEVQRSGVGTTLLAVLERRVQESGHPSIIVDSALTAINFYESCGYRVLGEQVYTCGEACFCCMRMCKGLPGRGLSNWKFQ